MIERELISRGVTDMRLLQAFAEVPRHEFIDSPLKYQAYQNQALPIGQRQTISQPYTVAVMLQSLYLRPGARVLDVGTGCGYQAALLSRLCQSVYTIERIPALLRQAKRRFVRLDYNNVLAKLGDGWEGWPEYAPYDGIVVAAFSSRLPEKLYGQLKEGGRLVVPIGDTHRQELAVFVHQGAQGPQQISLGQCAFVPFVETPA